MRPVAFTYLEVGDEEGDIFPLFLSGIAGWWAVDGDEGVQPKEWDQHEGSLQASSGNNSGHWLNT